MRAPSSIATGGSAFAFVCAFVASLFACQSDSGERGTLCARTSDCLEGLQCFDRVCTDLCTTHIDCGDGYRCDGDGECALVPSAIGDPCFREIDCGPGQACILDREDRDGNGTLSGTCTLQEPGLIVGQECTEDAQCRNGICALGHCTELCVELSDCPTGMACAQLPHLTVPSTRFGACVQGAGILTHEVAIDRPAVTLQIPVPSTAVSFAVITAVDEESHLAGVERVKSPDGTLLYVAPSQTEPDEFYDNPIRYQPARSISTLLVPNSPAIPLVAGVYEVDVATWLDGAPGTSVPRVRILYKVDSGSELQLHFHFLNLENHPCASAFDVETLSAATAARSIRFDSYLTEIARIFTAAGLRLAPPTFADISGRGDLDAIQSDAAGKLFTLSHAGNGDGAGIHVFIVRSISPAGVQAIAGGLPGPPLTPGTVASGVAIGADTLCYRSWTELARITAHAVARQMGLYYNRSPEGFADSIPDSDEQSSNLMFYGDLGGTSLSQGQGDVLRRYPGLQ